MFALVSLAALSCRGVGSGSSPQGYEPEQPINYSHKVHAGDNKMDCLYCHFGAEKSRHAGIPPANVCMNCHWMVKTESPEIKKIKDAIDTNTPIEWIRIHSLPDYVLFNHSRHVNGGVSCQECHGPVETMAKVKQVAPLTMGWCIECHRTKGIAAPIAKPGTEVGSDCASCHY